MKTLAQYLEQTDNPHTEKRGERIAVLTQNMTTSQKADMYRLADYFVIAVCGPYNELLPRLNRPCPFCGTKRTRIHEWINGAVIICECGGKGPEGYGPTAIQTACDLWNRRETHTAPCP